MRPPGTLRNSFATTPSSTATTGVPRGAAMSSASWGERSPRRSSKVSGTSSQRTAGTGKSEGAGAERRQIAVAHGSAWARRPSRWRRGVPGRGVGAAASPSPRGHDDQRRERGDRRHFISTAGMPGRTCSASAVASQLVSRMQPCDSERAMRAGSGVPWMP